MKLVEEKTNSWLSNIQLQVTTQIKILKRIQKVSTEYDILSLN